MTRVAQSLDQPDGQEPTVVGEFVEIVKTVVYALGIALVLRVLLFQPFTIPSESMAPNLLRGDYIIVSKFSYGWSKHSIPFSPPVMTGRLFDRAPTRGDIIVFKLPRDNRTDYIKRLVGMPGDRIQVRDGAIWVNGKPFALAPLPNGSEDIEGFQRPVFRFEETNAEGRTYVTNDYGPDYPLDNTETFLVPAGHYFFMGDNRDNSADSRLAADVGVGFVPAENLVGKAQLILLSWNDRASLFKPWTWVLNARPDRFFNVLK